MKSPSLLRNEDRDARVWVAQPQKDARAPCIGELSLLSLVLMGAVAYNILLSLGDPPSAAQPPGRGAVARPDARALQRSVLREARPCAGLLLWERHEREGTRKQGAQG